VVRFTTHAAARLRERCIREDWVMETIATPDRVMPDPADPALTRSFKAIPDAGGACCASSIAGTAQIG
jgi:hypothetical protein